MESLLFHSNALLFNNNNNNNNDIVSSDLKRYNFDQAHIFGKGAGNEGSFFSSGCLD